MKTNDALLLRMVEATEKMVELAATIDRRLDGIRAELKQMNITLDDALAVEIVSKGAA